MLSKTFADAMLQLPRANKKCPSCNHEEAVFFQSQQRSAETGMVRFAGLQTQCLAKLRAEAFLCLLRLRYNLQLVCVSGIMKR